MYRAISYQREGVAITQAEPDDYLAKLVKYVPVEGLAGAIPAAALATGRITLWITWIATLVLGIGLIAVQLHKKPKPRVHYWIFVVVAFFAWTVGSTDEFRELFNISDDLSKWILAITAWGLPGLDYVFPTARVEPEPEPEPELDLDSEPAE